MSTRFRNLTSVSAFRIFWVLFLSILLSALTSAIWGRFSVGAVWVSSLGFTGGFTFWQLRLVTGVDAEKIKSAPWSLATVLLALSSLLFTLPAGEWISGGWDPSVYLQTASQISETGGLLFEHQDLIAQSPEMRELLFRDVHGIPEPFGGMRIFEDKISPQFYHVYPALLALFVSIAGFSSALWVNSLLNVLSLCLMSLFARRWTGSAAWGFLAALALYFFPGQIWQAKFSTAELLTQVLILGGFLFLHRWSGAPSSNKIDAFLAGISLGCAFLTRYDTLMLLMVLAPVLCYFIGQALYRKGVLLFFVSWAFIYLIWVQHQKIAPFYSPLGPMVFKMVGLSVGLCFFTFLAGLFPWVQRCLKKFRTPLLWVLTAGWWGWMAVNWQIRPHLTQAGVLHEHLYAFFSPLGLGNLIGSFFGPAKVSMLYLESLFHPLGLFFVLLVVPVLWWQIRGPASAGWAFSGLAVMVVLTWQPLNDLFMIWVSRRFNSMVIPWLILGLAAGFFLLQKKVFSKKYNWIPPVVLLLLIGLQFPASRFMMTQREWPGALKWFENVAEALPEHAILYTDQKGFGSPFRFIWGKRAFELRKQNSVSLRKLLDHFVEVPPSEPIYFLTTSPVLRHEPGWESVGEFTLETSMIIQPRTRMPDGIRSRGGAFVLYCLKP
ncbi:hypothetical protein P0Y35_06395 [Kiritimatiellaeota bacterium B1221]|nr:hypothetical protein [Kiritimatiellaeota bacterium B1221]